LTHTSVSFATFLSGAQNKQDVSQVLFISRITLTGSTLEDGKTIAEMVKEMDGEDLEERVMMKEAAAGVAEKAAAAEVVAAEGPATTEEAAAAEPTPQAQQAAETQGAEEAEDEEALAERLRVNDHPINV